MIVIDESSSFKNRSTARWKACKAFTSIAKRVVILTGTPTPNGYMDLWSQIYLLDKGQRLGQTLTEYRNRYFYLQNLRFHQYRRLGEGNQRFNKRHLRIHEERRLLDLARKGSQQHPNPIG